MAILVCMISIATMIMLPYWPIFIIGGMLMGGVIASTKRRSDTVTKHYRDSSRNW
ncbi:hypothetical protein ACFL1A_01990 [Patescibacteria group bacterium]